MKRAIFLLCGLFFVSTVFAASPIEMIQSKKVIYELPYPGITPENPLYVFKQLRDTIKEILIRDYLKKAEFLLVSSDKRAHIALILARKGKTRQAVEVLADAEAKALKIPELLRISEKQGVSPSESFTYTLQLSNTKHRDVIQELIKLLPQGQEKQILNDVFELNKRVAKELEGV